MPVVWHYLARKSRGSVAYLEDASIMNVNVKDTDLHQAEKTAQDHIEGIKHRQFKPCTGESCIKCNYGLICKWRV